MSDFDFNDIQLSSTSDRFDLSKPSEILAGMMSDAYNYNVPNYMCSFMHFSYDQELDSIIIKNYDYNEHLTHLSKYTRLYNEILKGYSFEILNHIRFNRTCYRDMFTNFSVLNLEHTKVCRDFLKSLIKVDNGSIIKILDPEWLVWMIRMLERIIYAHIKIGATAYVRIASGIECVVFDKDTLISFVEMMKSSEKYVPVYSLIMENDIKSAIITNYMRIKRDETGLSFINKEILEENRLLISKSDNEDSEEFYSLILAGLKK